jgi:hypothetical protein
LTASHHDWSGQFDASSMNGIRREAPVCSARHANMASADVNASTWVRPSDAQVPQPPAGRFGEAVGIGSSNSSPARIRK